MNNNPARRLPVRLVKGVLAALLALTLSPALPAADAEAEIQAAEKEWAAAVVALDFAALDKIYDDGLIYAHSTGNIETKGEYLAKLRGGTQKYTSIEHHKTTIRTFPSAAVAHSIATMQGTNASGPFDNRLMMIHTWIKKDGRWRLVAHQTTQLAK